MELQMSYTKCSGPYTKTKVMTKHKPKLVKNGEKITLGFILTAITASFHKSTRKNLHQAVKISSSYWSLPNTMLCTFIDT
jgi:hypothetical protein